MLKMIYNSILSVGFFFWIFKKLFRFGDNSKLLKRTELHNSVTIKNNHLEFSSIEFLRFSVFDDKCEIRLLFFVHKSNHFDWFLPPRKFHFDGIEFQTLSLFFFYSWQILHSFDLIDDRQWRLISFFAFQMMIDCVCWRAHDPRANRFYSDR